MVIAKRDTRQAVGLGFWDWMNVFSGYKDKTYKH